LQLVQDETVDEDAKSINFHAPTWSRDRMPSRYRRPLQNESAAILTINVRGFSEIIGLVAVWLFFHDSRSFERRHTPVFSCQNLQTEM